MKISSLFGASKIVRRNSIIIGKLDVDLERLNDGELVGPKLLKILKRIKYLRVLILDSL